MKRCSRNAFSEAKSTFWNKLSKMDKLPEKVFWNNLFRDVHFGSNTGPTESPLQKKHLHFGTGSLERFFGFRKGLLGRKIFQKGVTFGIGVLETFFWKPKNKGGVVR